MKTKPIPSTAQAQLIARLWSGYPRTINVGSFIDPTVRVCVQREWLIKTGKAGKFPNGDPYSEYAVSKLGLLALENFLMEQRHKNVDLARS